MTTTQCGKATLWVLGAGILISLGACGRPAQEADVSIHTTTDSGAAATTTVTPTTTPTVVQHDTTVVMPPKTDTVVQHNTVVKTQTDTINAHKTVVRTPPTSHVAPADRARIDAWLAAHLDSLNSYGDPTSTVYAGGSPLFNEQTGQSTDKYDYIVSKHPDRPWMRMSTPRR